MAVTAKGWPYVLPSDTVTSYPTTSQAIADKLEAAAVPYAQAAGLALMPSNPTANTGTGLLVTFPASRFTQAPIVQATAVSNGYAAGSSSATSTTQVTVKYYNPTPSTPSSASIYWYAVQMLAGAAPGILLSAPGTVPATATCHTEGCGNKEIPIPIELDEDPGMRFPVGCGVCAQPIPDVVIG